MSVRAKFIVNSITRTKHWDANKGEVQTIKLMPVTSGSDENKSFYAATPSGTIELGTVNEEAAKQFELGKAYYVDFTPAES
jgi:hypothetical protein